MGSVKLPTFLGVRESVPHSPQFLYRPTYSNDALVMEILSDIMSQLPLTVENEEVSGPGSQSTFNFIVSSPIWERLHEDIQGE